MDKRREKTRKAIFGALWELLKKKNYKYITVQEIIDTACIGRSTFYSHFETKDELLRVMCHDLFKHIFSNNRSCESHDFTKEDYNLEKQLAHILYHVRDNRKELKAILFDENSHIFLRFFNEYLKDLFTPYIYEATLKVPLVFAQYITITSFVDTIRWYITEGKTYTPEQVAQYYMLTSIFTRKNNR